MKAVTIAEYRPACQWPVRQPAGRKTSATRTNTKRVSISSFQFFTTASSYFWTVCAHMDQPSGEVGFSQVELAWEMTSRHALEA